MNANLIDATSTQQYSELGPIMTNTSVGGGGAVEGLRAAGVLMFCLTQQVEEEVQLNGYTCGRSTHVFSDTTVGGGGAIERLRAAGLPWLPSQLIATERPQLSGPWLGHQT